MVALLLSTWAVIMCMVCRRDVVTSFDVATPFSDVLGISGYHYHTPKYLLCFSIAKAGRISNEIVF